MGLSLSAILWSVGWLVGRVVVGDTTCLNAALLVARLTFSRSVVCVLYFFLLRERIECGRSSWTATIYPFFVDEHYCMLGMLR